MIDISLMLNDDLPTKRVVLKQLIDAAFFILGNQRPETIKSKYEHDAFILFQLSSLRCVSILGISNECDYRNALNTSALRILDPFSVNALVRTLFEGYSNFHSIYIQSKSDDEIALKHDMWVLSGLKYRQQFPTTIEEHQIKKQKEKEEIEELLKSVKSNKVFRQLDATSQSKVLHGIEKKKWHIIVNGENAHVAHWQELFKNVISNQHFDKLYSALSLNTHPSNVSIFQFAALYNFQQETNAMRTAINVTNMIFSFLITDYCKYFTALSSVYERLPENSKFLIENHSKMRL